MILNEGEDLASVIESQTSRGLLKSRIVVLSEGIGSTAAKRVIEQLLTMEQDDPEKDIWIYLNSPGGEVSSGFGIYDTIRFIKPKVKIIVTGLAASIATVILLAADRENRISLPNSRLLIHQPLIGGNIQGRASDLEITANEILKTREKLVQLYHQETKQPIARLQKDIERDYWMTPSEALEYGLISRIVAHSSEIK